MPDVSRLYDSMPDQSSDANPSKSKRNLKSIISTIILFLAAPLFALILIFFVIQSYEVDGPSMETTLSHSDLLIVNKTPVTWASLTNGQYTPNRYDIIVFERRGGFTTVDQGGSQLIKRVIGIPGDRIVVQEGGITIYNDKHPNGFDPDKDQEYAKDIANTSGNIDILIPDNEVFVVGDNRDNSLDSRFFGTVKSEDIVGKLSYRLFPLNKAQSF